MQKPLLTALAAVTLISAGAAGAQPMGRWDNSPRDGQNHRGCYANERWNDCSQRRNAEQHSRHHYVWRDGRYQDEDNAGAAVAGGILGFVLGTAIAGSASDRDYYNGHRNDRGWRHRCSSAYPGFDYRNGTYIGQDGYRHYCTQ